MKTITFDDAKYALVPIEPTEEIKKTIRMVIRGVAISSIDYDNSVERVYKAMIKAAQTEKE